MNADKPPETVRFTCERCGAPAWWRTRLCDNCFERAPLPDGFKPMQCGYCGAWAVIVAKTERLIMSEQHRADCKSRNPRTQRVPFEPRAGTRPIR